MKSWLKISVLTTVLFSFLAFDFVASTSEAAVVPCRIVQIALISLPQDCAAGVMEQLCSSLTSFLNDEAAKADADLKACKDKCGWKKRKDDLVDAARKKAKESCSKGEAPDVEELSKGLDRNTKDRLKGLYDRNSRMFDGKAKLEAANFGAVTSKDATITGKGGKVTDLKSSEPDTPKLDSATEFSLVGTQLSGQPSGPSTPKQSTVLPAAPAQKAGATTAASASGQVVIPEIPQITIPEIPAIPDIPDPAWFEYRKDYCTIARSLPALLDAQKAKLDSAISKFKADYAKIDLTSLPPAAQVKLKGQYDKIILDSANIRIRIDLAKKSMEHDIASYCSGASSEKTGWAEKLGNWWHGLLRQEKCGDGWYNQNNGCCVDRVPVPQQSSCKAEAVAISGPSELILYKPAENSKPIRLSFLNTQPIDCACPKTKTILWSLADETKAALNSAPNRAVVNIRAVSESKAKKDVSVTVIVDGVASAPKLLTVRRPAKMEHPALVTEPLPETLSAVTAIRTDSSFRWTLGDQFGNPLANVPVTEDVTLDPTSTGVATWTDRYESKTTNAAGQIQDQYLLDANTADVRSGQVNARVIQALNAAGWTGTSNVRFTMTQTFEGSLVTITGESPVFLK